MSPLVALVETPSHPPGQTSLFELAPAKRPQRGPRGVRAGWIVIADGARWEVVDLDPSRREAVCRLLGGSRVLHRFRARQISRVERPR